MLMTELGNLRVRSLTRAGFLPAGMCHWAGTGRKVSAGLTSAPDFGCWPSGVL
jgi:hypothetical protein